MSDSNTHPGISQETIDEAKAVAGDPKVVQAVQHPTPVNIFNAAQEPVVGELVASTAAAVNETKKGYRTTEFWATVAALIGVNLNGVILTLPDKYQGIISGALVIAYALSRGAAKKGIPDVEPSPVSVAPEAAIVQR